MDLTDALGIGEREVVALVGGGGKTTSMYRICAEAAIRGRFAVASGTARFTEPSGGARVPVLVDEDEGRLLDAVRRAQGRHPWVIAAAGHGSKERLLPISNAMVAKLAEEAAVALLILEADGSAMRAFKAPAGHEPAVPPAATLLVAIVGADIFGRPLTEELVHRPERVTALSGAAGGSPVTPGVVAEVLGHPAGGRKALPAAARFAVLINKVTPSRLAEAREAAGLLLQRGVPLVVLAQAREEVPVVEILRL